MKTKTENKSRSKMRKREIMTLEFMWKISKEIKKTMSSIKNSIIKNKQCVQGFTQVKSFNPSQTT